MKINTISPDKHKYLQITDTIAKKQKILHYIGKLLEALAKPHYFLERNRIVSSLMQLS